MHKLNKKYLPLLLALVIILLAGTAWAQGDDIGKILKSKLRPTVPMGQRQVDLIGIVPPGLGQDASAAELQDYYKEYGINNIQVISYRGYSLIIPPGKESGIKEAEQKIDQNLKNQTSAEPSELGKTQDINQIRLVFGTKGTLAYNSVIGGYVDAKGFQYNFNEGKINKQIAIMSVYSQAFKDNYPYLNEKGTAETRLSDAEAIGISNSIVKKVLGYPSSQSLLITNTVPVSKYTLGISYFNGKVNVLIDKVSGDIISLNQE